MSKTDSAGTTSYKRAGAYVTDSLLKSTVSSTTTDYTPGVSSRVGSDSTYLHSGIKSADTQTDDGGDVSAMRRYDAFGNPVTAWGGWQGPFGYGGPYGYQTDPDHGLILLGHRYYEAETGRFLTRDPIKDGRNWFVYCGNKPLRRTDPSGLEWHDPMVVYIDPGFEGVVTVVGEPGLGKRHVSVVVPPGHHSNPCMDVDYIKIKYKNGREIVVFVPGWGTPWNPDNSPQLTVIDKNGRVRTNGPLSVSGDLVSPFWLPKYARGVDHSAPSYAQPVRGEFLIPKRARRQAPPPASARPIPVGSVSGSGGTLRWH